ncbi:MAG TPA: lantibiotic dehydratase, partial [Polyangia bacterium]|nr:lantibiotic dehydratase [Polyangia bacterium]
MARPPASRSSLVPAGFFALRTPLLPLAELLALGDGLTAVAAEPAQLADALAADRRLVQARLRALVTRPEVREALFIASPSLDESLPVWLEAPDGERGQKVERTLTRYVARMTTRPTPFGLFAGCSVGLIADTTQLVLAGRDSYRRHTRLDNDYLSTLVEALLADPALRAAVRYRPSSSLYRAAGRWRYAEARLNGRVREYSLVAVDPSPYLDGTIARAANGATLAELAGALVDGDAAGEITRADADDYLAQLVDGQILVAELAPHVTGAEPIHDLVAQLATPAPQVAAALGGVRDALAALDGEPLGAPPSRYRAVADSLAALPAKPELARLFQVDMVKPAAQATLGAEPLAELTRVVTLLSRLHERPRATALLRFAEAFSARYEQRELPLAEVLDEEAGIGFDRATGPSAEASPLLATLQFPSAAPGDGPALNPLQQLLLRRLPATLRSGADELLLEEKELEALAQPEAVPLSGSLAAIATLAAADGDAVARCDFRWWLHGVNGPSGANLLGRFCYGDEQLTALVREHLCAEEAQRPDAVFAEIVHLPEGRIGNILMRPLLRGHEIAFLGRSGAPADAQLGLDDLRVAVVDGRVVLRSRRLGREIIPRLTSAHNFSAPRNLGLYRFLCALQYQGGGAAGFDWGALAGAGYLPRVRVGRVVLSLARWRLDRVALERLDVASASDRFARVQALRRELGLPRFISVADGDNVLPIDLDNTLYVETFVQLVKDRHDLVLTELFAPDRLLARGPEGAFLHELVVPLLGPPPAARSAGRAATLDATARSLPPGSDCLYAKVYCGTGSADLVLRQRVAPLVAAARERGLCDRWFFIRYADPDFHLRLRFFGDGERLSALRPLVEAAAAASLADGHAWKLQLDTYEREIERYGGIDGLAACERLFAADSDATLAILDMLDGDAGADGRWRLTLRGMDQLLVDLGLTLGERQALMQQLRDAFAREHRVDARFGKQLGDRFRSERQALEALLDRAQDAASDFQPGCAVFDERSARIAPVAAELRALAADGRLTVSLADLAGSLLHMHANRMLRGAARAQELVLYDFLAR